MGKLTVHTTEKQLGGEGCSSRTEQQPQFFFREAETNMRRNSQRRNSPQNEIMINYYSFLTQPVCVRVHMRVSVCVCLGKGKIL